MSLGARRLSVYAAREDTELLRPFARDARGLCLLEVGCGGGSLALTAARAGARVVATDLNPRAVGSLRARAHAEGVRLEVVRADLFRGLRRFDRILANPPYLPTPPAARDPDPWVNLALDGGPDGLAITRRLVDGLPDHLAPGGRAYLVVSSRQPAAGLERILGAHRARGGGARTVARTELGGEQLEVLELEVHRASRP